jgi:dTDP-4-dehydrorhamnose reductase
MRILITGGRGQLGSDCADLLRVSHEVILRGSRDLDITDDKTVETAIEDYRPDIVLNCAAFTKVDACETERQRAWKTNVDGPRNLSSSLKRHGGKLIHISTDYVFDGLRTPPEPYTEEDKPSPLSYYGRTKLEGEEIIKQSIDNYTIIRTAWLYGINGHNFLKTILRLATKNPGGEIRVVNDQYGSPTWTYTLARQISIIIDTDKKGIYHATSEGFCTWYELALYFLDIMGVEHSIVPCKTEEYPTPAKRPRNSILENKRLKKEGINIMPYWQEDIERFVEDFNEELKAEVRGDG